MDEAHDDSDDLDDESEDDDLFVEELQEKRTVVWSVFWDSGGPGAGAGEEEICKLDGSYWYYSPEEGLFGPYLTLAQAVEETQQNMVNEATMTIDSPILPAAEIAALLKVWETDEYGLGVGLNGEGWVYDRPGRFRPARPDEVA